MSLSSSAPLAPRFVYDMPGPPGTALTGYELELALVFKCPECGRWHQAQSAQELLVLGIAVAQFNEQPVVVPISFVYAPS